MTSIRVSLTILCALTLAFAPPVTAQPNNGSDNTAVGKHALKSNTTGSFNTAVGADALESNTTGSENTAVGADALLSNTTGGQNTAVGVQALQSNTTGGANTVVGVRALQSNTEGGLNTAAGRSALSSNTTGFENTAVGEDALSNNTTGGQNTAMGVHALNNNTTGFENTAIGFGALGNSTGLRNIAIGFNAGVNVTTGSDNIHIGNVGVGGGDTSVIRLGSGVQTAAFFGGIFNQTSPEGAAVLVNINGKLGTVLSSRRVKADISAMAQASQDLLKLRPVTFRYKAEHDDGARLLQYGLIAEEVAEIYPELVVLDKDGRPSGVRYHVLPAMLLNELQRQQREIEELRTQMRALVGEKAAVRE